jgi:hypothetical protein
MINEFGSFLGLIEILSWYLPGETEGNHINLRIAGVPADIQTEHLEYKVRVLTAAPMWSVITTVTVTL